MIIKAKTTKNMSKITNKKILKELDYLYIMESIA